MADVPGGAGVVPWRAIRRVLVGLLLACVSLTGEVRPVGAGASTAVRAQADVVEAGDLASASEARLLELIEAAEARRREIESKAGEVNAEVEDLRSGLNAAEDHLGALQARMWTLEHRLEASNRQLEESRGRRQELALDAYTGRASALSYATELLYADDLGALAARRSYVHFLGSSQAEVLAQEEGLRDGVEDLLEELDGVRREMSRKRAGASADAAQVEHGQRVRVGLLEQAEGVVAARDQAFGEARARQAEFDAELAALAAQSDAVTQTLRARRGLAADSSDASGSESEASAAASGGELAHPLPGHSLGSAFGPRVHPVFGSVRVHTGVDIGGDEGDAIHSAGDGVVVSAGWLGGYGNATIVDHGGGVATLYGHQSVISVSDGERVSRGEVIGRVGCTGTCTGDHLHFEVRIDGDPVNPVPYIT
ncbi:MAG TPA: peptidoglycan DD-metalloendopeptidase family protein [Acidimicrobiales bacterium]|nr:peptidoglycan DD-metalloendopeptidase family protein [Acidimicrobiales bacterium]